MRKSDGMFQYIVRLLGIATLLTGLAIIAGCNDTNSTPSDGEQGKELSGHLYYEEGRYGKEKVTAYISLDISSLTSSIISTDNGVNYSLSQDKSQFLTVDPTLTIIHVYDYSGTLVRSIDLGYTISGIPRFSPDNKYIAVQIKNSYAHKYLAIFDSAGEVINVVDIDEMDSERDGVRGVDWTPGGQVVYAAYGKIYRLLDIEGDEVEIIKSLASKFDVFSVRVSPDGSKLAFIANESYLSKIEGDIYIMNIDGSGLREVARVTGKIRSFTDPAWGPDNRHVAAQYAENWAGASCGVIWVFDTEAGAPALVDEGTSEGEMVGGYKIDTADYEVHGLCADGGLDWH